MPFIPVPDTLLVETIFELDNQVVENTTYFKHDTGWDEAAISDFLQAIKNLIVTDLIPLLSSVTHLVRLVGTLLDAIDAVSVVFNVSPPVGGLASGQPLPNNTSYVITFNTSGRGRSNRGRNYAIGLTSDDQDGANGVLGDYRTGLLAYYSALKALATANAATMVVVSRFSGVDADHKPIPRVTGVTRPITSFSTSDFTLDSQRRRLPGRGS